MLERVTIDGVVFYRSPALAQAGFPHAFSTRIGGVSPPPFDSLNLRLAAAALRETARRMRKLVERDTIARVTEEPASATADLSSEAIDIAPGPRHRRDGHRRSGSRRPTYLQPEEGFEPWAPQPGYFRMPWRAYARLGFDVAPLVTAAGGAR